MDYTNIYYSLGNDPSELQSTIPGIIDARIIDSLLSLLHDGQIMVHGITYLTADGTAYSSRTPITPHPVVFEGPDADYILRTSSEFTFVRPR